MSRLVPVDCPGCGRPLGEFPPGAVIRWRWVDVMRLRKAGACCEGRPGRPGGPGGATRAASVSEPQGHEEEGYQPIPAKELPEVLATLTESGAVAAVLRDQGVADVAELLGRLDDLLRAELGVSLERVEESNRWGQVPGARELLLDFWRRWVDEIADEGRRMT